MSSPSPSTPRSSFQDKMAASLGTIASLNAGAPAEPPVAPLPAPATASPATAAAPPSAPLRETRAAKPAASKADGNTINATVTVDPGVGSVAVTFRCPRNVHARLRMLTLTMQIEDASTAQSMNDIMLEAVVEKLEKLERQRQQTRAA